MKLSNEEIARYSRHLTLPEVGMAGQLKLKTSRILMIGAGGLGSPLGIYLGAAGVGKLGVIAFDVVAQALVMVMHGDRKHAFGVYLTNHIIIQYITNFLRCWNAIV